MARMIPNHVEICEEISSAEHYLHTQLKTLPDSYTVFHSVAWQVNGKGGRPTDGETDFIITHPHNGILVLEVKGGAIKFDAAANKWTSTSLGGNPYAIKNPFDQAKSAKFALIELLKKIHPAVRTLNIGHAVAFPEVTMGVGEQGLGTGMPRATILDMADAAFIEEWVESAMRYWQGETNALGLGKDGISALTDTLAKSWDLQPALWGEIRQEQADLIRLTQEQYHLLDMLNRQRRVAISGCAGSGKTLLAVEKATRLTKQGFRVLLTCYNRNLARFMDESVGSTPNLDVRNFHKLCFDLAREADLLPLETDSSTQFYNELLPDVMMDAADQLNTRYDAIIVDEGQDFRPQWWLPLQTLLEDPDDGILYIFFDENQRIYAQQPSDSTSPIQTPPFMLTVNCRNTRLIHQQVSRFVKPNQQVLARGPLGRPVTISRFKSGLQLQSALTDTIRHLTQTEKIPPSEITVLTPLTRRKSDIWLADGFRGVNFTNAWPPEQNEVHCNTIHAFKGLESSVVILAEIDEWTRKPKELDSLLYVACSRAKNHLVVLLPETAPTNLEKRFV